MARVTRQLSAAWMREAILVVDGAAPSRHFWSRWMDRALAPHQSEMATPHAPIAANDIEAESEEEPLRGHARGPVQPVLRYD
jgi:hypothetical protein